MSRTNALLMLSATVVGTALMSYLFALAGEPQSYWLWHTVLGLA